MKTVEGIGLGVLTTGLLIWMITGRAEAIQLPLMILCLIGTSLFVPTNILLTNKEQTKKTEPPASKFSQTKTFI
ncbi:hypothetical protein NRIC_03620 [Enterococcus florum]|uniref:Uncharacterized protein n=1 Tax=Enterococcus florum TaxID=2480627 RepID=A0A4P5P8C5_9ENTE|nr:hypothetical protein [Enterococcus florum]GCF92471.1 hypothetical protein NRIC_03620 [Enterococcus florum]